MKHRSILCLIAALAALGFAPAMAQPLNGVVASQGAITANHVACYTSNNIIKDCGGIFGGSGIGGSTGATDKAVLRASGTGGATLQNSVDTIADSGKLTITMGTANDPVIATTGFSLTGANAQSLLDLAGTWNTSGTPTGIKLVITDTSSNAASLLMDLQTGTGSKYSVGKGGLITTPITDGSIYVDGNGDTLKINNFAVTGGGRMQIAGASIVSAVNGFAFGGSQTANEDTFLLRLAAANVQQGKTANATPVGQTFTLGESSRAGTDTNIGGASGTIQSGNGTGTGATSCLNFQTPAQVASGSGAQTQTTRFSVCGSTATAAALNTVIGDLKVTPGTAPTAGTCGTTPTITAGSSDTAGEITAGTATPTSCAINFGTTKASAPFCIVANETNNLAAFTYVVSTTAITVTQTATSSDKIVWHCIQH